MSQRVLMPGGQVAEFPDGMTPAKIEQAIRQTLGLPEPTPPPPDRVESGDPATQAMGAIWGAGPPPGGKTTIQKMADPLVPLALTSPVIGAAGAAAAPLRAAPYVGKAIPAAARVATAAGIGAATHPDKPLRGAVTGAAEQAIGGEAIAPIATRIAQRFGARAFERLSDELADQIMTRAKALIPKWRELPEGQAGVRALLEDKGMKLLSEGWNQMEARRAGFRIGRLTPESEDKARETFREGINLVNALRGMKTINPSTGRVDPEALVEGMAKASGVKNPQTVWDRFLTERRAPGAKRLVQALREAARSESGAAPSIAEVRLPFLRASGHHMAAGEGLPVLRYSKNVPTTLIEKAVRELAPGAGGAATMGAVSSFEDLAGQAKR